MYRNLFVSFLFSSLISFSVYAEGISTHVLDLASGFGGPNIPVVLEKKGEDGLWNRVGSEKTDNNGRVKAFGTNLKLAKGLYRLNFDMTKYSNSKSKPFFPEMSIVFQVEDLNFHYHVPVVVSPYGYSTYRGN